jgi:hypothetical protein
MCNKFWLVKNVQQPHLYVVQGRKNLNDFQQEPWLWVRLLSFSFIANVFSSHRAILIVRNVCNLYIFPFSRTRVFDYSRFVCLFCAESYFSPHLQRWDKFTTQLRKLWGRLFCCFVINVWSRSTFLSILFTFHSFWINNHRLLSLFFRRERIPRI